MILHTYHYNQLICSKVYMHCQDGSCAWACHWLELDHTNGDFILVGFVPPSIVLNIINAFSFFRRLSSAARCCRSSGKPVSPLWFYALLASIKLSILGSSATWPGNFQFLLICHLRVHIQTNSSFWLTEWLDSSLTIVATTCQRGPRLSARQFLVRYIETRRVQMTSQVHRSMNS